MSERIYLVARTEAGTEVASVLIGRMFNPPFWNTPEKIEERMDAFWDRVCDHYCASGDKVRLVTMGDNDHGGVLVDIDNYPES